MYEVIFLLALAFLYITFAVFQDIKTKEIFNWISFSLIIFALTFRFFYSIFEGDNFTFFYMGLIGFGIFFLLGNLLYYSRVFAGGDAKIMIALGAILPISPDIFQNLKIFFSFFIIFLLAGFLYTLITSAFLFVKNFNSFKKEFSKQFKKTKTLICTLTFLSLIFLILGFLWNLFFVLGLLLFITSYLYIYSKSIDEACMIKKVKAKDLEEGDWLYSDLRIGKKVIKATWDGLTEKDIREIRKSHKEVRIRDGIPFSPVFWISFMLISLLIFFNINLWNPFW